MATLTRSRAMVEMARSRPTRIVEGVHNCVVGVLVLPDCLGRDYTATVVGRSVKITLPSINQNDPKGSLLAPQWVHALGDFAPQPLWGWGDVTYGLINEQRVQEPIPACVIRFRFEIHTQDENQACAAEAQPVVDGLAAWWNTARAWIDVATGQSGAGPTDNPLLDKSLRVWSIDDHGTLDFGRIRPASNTFK